MSPEHDAGRERGNRHREQQIVAAGGYAYGTQDADVYVHVEQDRSPVYRVRSLPASGPEGSRGAGHGVRTADLARLEEWRGTPARLALLWLHGPEAASRSRLADRFAAGSAVAGWRVVTAVRGSETTGPGAPAVEGPGQVRGLRQDRAEEGDSGLLMVVENADHWPLPHLTWLFSNALLHRAGVPARVLLTAETLDHWVAVRGTVANHRAATSAHRVERCFPSEGP
ncbi:hypothetical protein AB0O18_12215 [Streptomyces sp. NPDC093224]|uniref:hypothetical protein n=1 Tax=Streptomyces sp. NPDC093224 TaxID=3155198 RepID=UPI0034165908